jgi:hypothetical protein
MKEESEESASEYSKNVNLISAKYLFTREFIIIGRP